KEQYVICTGEAKDAGMKCVQKAFPAPTLRPLICPPDSDALPHTRHRLSAGLHMIKCHGNKMDATFWGFEERDVSKDKPCPAITTTTLRRLPHLKRPTVVATMCCYGAQIFSPEDRGAKERGQWPMASTYLRKGAVGFIGSTMMAWVGLDDLSAADWIVTDYLRR